MAERTKNDNKIDSNKSATTVKIPKSSKSSYNMLFYGQNTFSNAKATQRFMELEHEIKLLYTSGKHEAVYVGGHTWGNISDSLFKGFGFSSGKCDLVVIFFEEVTIRKGLKNIVSNYIRLFLKQLNPGGKIIVVSPIQTEKNWKIIQNTIIEVCRGKRDEMKHKRHKCYICSVDWQDKDFVENVLSDEGFKKFRKSILNEINKKKVTANVIGAVSHILFPTKTISEIKKRLGKSFKKAKKQFEMEQKIKENELLNESLIEKLQNSKNSELKGVCENQKGLNTALNKFIVERELSVDKKTSCNDLVSLVKQYAKSRSGYDTSYEESERYSELRRALLQFCKNPFPLESSQDEYFNYKNLMHSIAEGDPKNDLHTFLMTPVFQHLMDKISPNQLTLKKCHQKAERNDINKIINIIKRKGFHAAMKSNRSLGHPNLDVIQDIKKIMLEGSPENTLDRDAIVKKFYDKYPEVDMKMLDLYIPDFVTKTSSRNRLEKRTNEIYYSPKLHMNMYEIIRHGIPEKDGQWIGSCKNTQLKHSFEVSPEHAFLLFSLRYSKGDRPKQDFYTDQIKVYSKSHQKSIRYELSAIIFYHEHLIENKDVGGVYTAVIRDSSQNRFWHCKDSEVNSIKFSEVLELTQKQHTHARLFLFKNIQTNAEIHIPPKLMKADRFSYINALLQLLLVLYAGLGDDFLERKKI